MNSPGPMRPRMDFVITLCDTLSGEACPEFGKLAVTAAWPLPDPAKFQAARRAHDLAQRGLRQPAAPDRDFHLFALRVTRIGWR